MKAAEVAEPAVGDAYLVARAQEGYIDAYKLLVQRHSAMACRVALRLTGNHHDAQDVAQGGADRGLGEPDPVPRRFVVFHLAVPDREPPCANKLAGARPPAHSSSFLTSPTPRRSPPCRPNAT